MRVNLGGVSCIRPDPPVISVGKIYGCSVLACIVESFIIYQYIACQRKHGGVVHGEECCCASYCRCCSYAKVIEELEGYFSSLDGFFGIAERDIGYGYGSI